jgi:hypothetical protein
LILFPLLMLSQKATINPRNETVTLDKEKTIDVAKIILNEDRLKHFIDSLVVQVQTLENNLVKLETEAVFRFEELRRIRQRNDVLQQELVTMAEMYGSTKKVPQKASFYLVQSTSGNKNEIRSFSFGLGMTLGRGFYSFQVDPLITTSMSYQLGLGIKIF